MDASNLASILAPTLMGSSLSSTPGPADAAAGSGSGINEAEGSTAGSSDIATQVRAANSALHARMADTAGQVRVLKTILDNTFQIFDED